MSTNDTTQASAPAIGIDLGTTFSLLAQLDERGRPITVVNAEGDLLTPSVVLFEGDDVVVGKEALKAMAVEADHVAECSKRDVGYRVYHKTLEGKKYPPEVIEAYILNKLRTDAQKQIGPFSKVVITVPAYFDEVRRKATQDAGYMAGFEVLDIINEPTAAALAFGFQHGYLGGNGSDEKPQHILVYDLGGGTFDVTVMEIRGTQFNALATDGDVRLGGYDWDQRLLDLVAKKFAAEHRTNPKEDPVTAGKLWRECEDAKRTLTARQKATVACEFRGIASRIEISRIQFEEATQDLLDRTRFTTSQALKAAGLEWNDIAPGADGGRFQPDAHGARRCSASFPARSPRIRWRPTRPLRTGRRCKPRWSSPTNMAFRRLSRSPTSTRTAWAWWASIRPRSAAATAFSSPATPPCPWLPSARSARKRPASARSASRSSRAKAPRPTTALASGIARSASCPTTCPPRRRSTSCSAIGRTAG